MNDQAKLIVIGASVGLVLLVGAVIVGRKLLTTAAKAVDITSDQNAAYQGTAAVVQAITGGAASGGEDTVGGVAARFREWISGDDAKIRAMLTVTPPAKLTEGALTNGG